MRMSTTAMNAFETRRAKTGGRGKSTAHNLLPSALDQGRMTIVRRIACSMIGAVSLLAVASGDARAACSEPTDDEATKVVFYWDSECRGESTTYDLAGENGGEFGNVGDRWNDQVSSIKVGKNVKVTIYDNATFGGARATLWRGSYPSMGIYNDVVSSLKIEEARENEIFVTLYEHEQSLAEAPNQRIHVLGEGKFNFDGNQEQLLLRDEVSRMAMSGKDVEVTLYTDYNGRGEKWTNPRKKDGILDYKLHTRGWGDRVKSIEVTRLKPEDVPRTLRQVKVTGKWVEVVSCGGARCGTSERGIDIGVQKGTEVSRTTDIGKSLSVMIGAEATGTTGALPGGSVTARLEVTGAVSRNDIETIAESFSVSETSSVKQTCTGEGRLYQWVSDMEAVWDVGDVGRQRARANLFACPEPGSNPPLSGDFGWGKQIKQP